MRLLCTAASPDEISKDEATVRSTYWASDTKGPAADPDASTEGYYQKQKPRARHDGCWDDGQLLKPSKSQTFII